MADVLLGGIAINEVLADPNGSLNYDTDGNGTAFHTDEFVELVNTSGSAIDISGLQLWDSGNDNWFTFPPGTVLQPGAHAMVVAGVQSGGSLPTGAPGDLFFDAGRTSAVINNSGDNIVVYDPANDEYIVATFNGDPQDDPTAGGPGYTGFSSTATLVGSGESMGNDTDGQSLQRVNDSGTTFASNTPTAGTANVCFADGTLIATPGGPRRAETLRPGDLVMTLDHGAQPVLWVWAQHWTAGQIRGDPHRAPIRIAQGAFGGGLPTRPLRVSRQHRLMVAGPIVRRMFGCDEVLVPACALLDLPGVSLERPDGPVAYVHLLLAGHEILLAEGLPAESLYLGPAALATIPPRGRAEIARSLGRDPCGGPAPRARPFAEGRRAARLVARHARNAKPPMIAAAMA